MIPILAVTDYTILRNLLRQFNPFRNDKELVLLSAELNKANVMEDQQVDNEIVRLNSHVTIREEQSGKISKFQIVLPQHADLKSGKVSVLAPMSIALLGFREGYSFNWKMPGGLKRISIVSVKTEQPVLTI